MGDQTNAPERLEVGRLETRNLVSITPAIPPNTRSGYVRADLYDRAITERDEARAGRGPLTDRERRWSAAAAEDRARADRYREALGDLGAAAERGVRDRSLLSPEWVKREVDAVLAEGEQPAGEPQNPWLDTVVCDHLKSTGETCERCAPAAGEQSTTEPVRAWELVRHGQTLDVTTYPETARRHERRDGNEAFPLVRSPSTTETATGDEAWPTGADLFTAISRPFWNAIDAEVWDAVRNVEELLPTAAVEGALTEMRCLIVRLAAIVPPGVDDQAVAESWRIVGGPAAPATPEGRTVTVSADDVRLLALLDDGEHDPTDPGYESLCERGLVEFSARVEGWELTDTGRRAVDAAATPEGTDA